MIETNPFENFRRQLDNVKMYFPDTDHRYIEILKCPQRVVEMCLPLRMDDGSIQIFTGYRVLRVEAP